MGNSSPRKTRNSNGNKSAARHATQLIRDVTHGLTENKDTEDETGNEGVLSPVCRRSKIQIYKEQTLQEATQGKPSAGTFSSAVAAPGSSRNALPC